MSLSTILLSLLSAFIGATLNNLYNRFHTKRQNKLQNTMRLFDEFHSKEMLESRNKAYYKLIDNLSHEHPVSLDEIQHNLGHEEFYHIQRVLYFFEKVIVLNSYGQLESPLIWRLLGDIFSYWLHKCLNPQLHIERSMDSNWVGLLEFINGLETQLQKRR